MTSLLVGAVKALPKVSLDSANTKNMRQDQKFPPKGGK